jgi:hypothetical protein
LTEQAEGAVVSGGVKMSEFGWFENVGFWAA